jgi:hypothetical protein
MFSNNDDNEKNDNIIILLTHIWKLPQHKEVEKHKLQDCLQLDIPMQQQQKEETAHYQNYYRNNKILTSSSSYNIKIIIKLS